MPECTVGEAEAEGTLQRLRILIIMHMPWCRDLGAPRVSVELADEWSRLGHTVEKFDIDDAFPKRSRVSAFFEAAQFPNIAAHYVRKHGKLFDVIQAEHGNLPFTKAELNFNGVLISRSNGLAHFYRDFENRMALQRGRQPRRSMVGRILRMIAKKSHGDLVDVESSFRSADAIMVSNRDEMDYVADNLGWGDKVYLGPNGMSEDRLEQFGRLAVQPAHRLNNPMIVFIGSWEPRKGAHDLPAIVRQIRSTVPEARFHLLGTGHNGRDILTAFASQDRDSVVVTPRFSSLELPPLLANGTASVFPSYIEGFPFAVLETLAAGIPTVAYDVPGPREMLRHFSPPAMVPAGDTTAMAETLLRILQAPATQYLGLAAQSLQTARQFRWLTIAEDYLRVYRRYMAAGRAG